VRRAVHVERRVISDGDGIEVFEWLWSWNESVVAGSVSWYFWYEESFGGIGALLLSRDFPTAFFYRMTQFVRLI
jgi:hypothetical protein